MYLRHGIESFPECVGSQIQCCGCQEPLQLSDAISIEYIRPNPDGSGREQLLQFLVCTTCTLKRVEPFGVA